jgi:hypothetical protein
LLRSCRPPTRLSPLFLFANGSESLIFSGREADLLWLLVDEGREMHKYLLTGIVGLAASALITARAEALIVTHDINTAYSGAQSAGTPPFIQIAFDDAIAPGAVRMIATAPGLNASEWVARIYLNLDPALDVEALFFSNFAVNMGTMLQPIIFTDNNGFEAGGGGMFDVEFAFSVSGGGFTRRFNQGESFQFDITGPPGLNANSFSFVSAPPAPSGVQAMGVLIQGIGANADEGFHTVPEPAGMLPLLVGLVASRRRVGLRLTRPIKPLS